MAAVPAVSVSIEEYLNTSYEGAFEYVDGELKEKTVTGHAHGQVQGLLYMWFHQHRKEWGIACSVETHTRVSPTRVRLPDVVVIGRGTAPKHTIVQAPLLAIEVFSPSNQPGEPDRRARDLAAMGTADIWLIDPEQRSGFVWDGSYWSPADTNYLRSSTSEIYVDLDWLWAELDDSQ